MAYLGGRRLFSAFTPIRRRLELHMTSRVVRFHQTGAPEVLQIETLDTPAPGPGEVRIRVQAIGLNRAEAAFRAGQYFEMPQLPARIGYEAAGVVDALGPDVNHLAIGSAVNTLPGFSMNRYGVYGEYAIVPASALMERPTMSAVESAALWKMLRSAAQMPLAEATGRIPG